MKRQRPRPQYTIGVDIAQEQCVWVQGFCTFLQNQVFSR